MKDWRERRKPMPEVDGFVKLSYASSDGTKGEVVYATSNPQDLFENMRREAMYGTCRVVPDANQLTLSLEPLQASN
jgi:hypothetical protein